MGGIGLTSGGIGDGTSIWSAGIARRSVQEKALWAARNGVSDAANIKSSSVA
jgi:hypothetical protein